MSDSMSTRPPASARKGYTTPRLVTYGRVEQLTQGTGTKASDGAGGRTNSGAPRTN